MKFLIVLLALSFLNGCTANKPNILQSDRHYVVVDVEISDMEKFEKFRSLEDPMLKKYDTYVVIDLRSNDQKRRSLTFSLPNAEALNTIIHSEEYQKIHPLLGESAKTNVFQGKLHSHKQ